MNKFKNKLIGIAGGSGSGKSTVAISLFQKYPDDISIIHTDDYFKAKKDTPLLEGFTNWDHPDGVNFDQLKEDLKNLLDNKPIKVLTKSELYNPEFKHELKNKIEITIQPKPIIILEGFLALYDEEIRNWMDLKIYLDIPIESSVQRRTANKFQLDKEYKNKVLTPMYKQFVEPTKNYADLILNTDLQGTEEVLKAIEEQVKKGE